MKRTQALTRIVLAAVCALVWVGWPEPAAASDSNWSTVTGLQLEEGSGIVWYYIQTSTPASAPCASMHRWFTFQKSVYDQALAAWLSGRPIHIVGLGTCNQEGDSEDIYYLELAY